MGRVNEDKWLEQALDKAIHSDDTQPDFEQWVASHPEAVQELTSRSPMRQPHWIRRIAMNGTLIKVAAAAVIAVVAIAGIAQLTGDNTTPVAAETLTGPTIHTFADGSTVKLAERASIRTYAEAGKRGFEHLAGEIDITVAKGKGEFIVSSPYGDVKALGTQFTMDLVDGVTANTKEQVKLLAVEVTEGTVEVRNAQGVRTLRERQNAVLTADEAPYDFQQDEKLPAELRARIQAMVDALEARDGAAWVANYNIDYLYKLAKGQVQYDAHLFGGTAEDAANFQKGLGDKVQNPEQLAQILGSSLNHSDGKFYVRSVELNEAGDHAKAECVTVVSDTRMIGHFPQWHYFDGGWWQVDD